MAIMQLKIHSMQHQMSGSMRGDRPKRPEIDASGTAAQWTVFTSMWADYKELAQIKPSQVANELSQCCTLQLRTSLIAMANGSMAANTEAEVLAAMKSLALSKEKATVSIDNLFRIKQDHGETIRSYSARVRMQANICDLTIPCTCARKVSASPLLQKHVIIRGLADKSIRQEMLSHPDDKLSLEDTIAFMEARESGVKGEIDMPSSYSAGGLSGIPSGKSHQPQQLHNQRHGGDQKLQFQLPHTNQGENATEFLNPQGGNQYQNPQGGHHYPYPQGGHPYLQGGNTYHNPQGGNQHHNQQGGNQVPCSHCGGHHNFPRAGNCPAWEYHARIATLRAT